MNRLIPLGIILALGTTPAFAFDDTDRDAVQTVLDTLSTSTLNGDYASALRTISPVLMEKMAEPTGMSVEDFKTLIETQMTAAMSAVKFEEMTYDLENMQTATTEAGRDYAIVDTTVVMEVGGQKVKAVGPTLVYDDNGSWYALRVEAPEQKAIVDVAYPDLAEVSLPASVIEPIE